MVPFSKYTGAGNDFVVVDATRAADADPARLARTMCARETGVGVDGLALARPREGGRVQVRFFNPDGSEFATCGNGSRCVARWAVDRGLGSGGRVDLETAEGEVEARVGDGEVALEYRIEAWVVGPEEVPFRSEPRQGWLVSMGTPHFVLPLPRLPEGPIEDLCRPVREHPALGPAGANVNLVERLRDERARIRTFERGVEGETLACGAGSMATALALHHAGECGPTLRLETRGGHRLRVDLGQGPGSPSPPPTGERARRHIRLTGPARPVFHGEFLYPDDQDGDSAAARESGNSGDEPVDPPTPGGR